MSEQPILLIVGAGPTGLAAGIGLARAGVPFRIIEKAIESVQTSRALGIQCRTLEMLDPLGLTSELLAAGNQITQFCFNDRESVLAEINFSDNGGCYPFVLILPQIETERILEARLSALGHRVERGVELCDIRQVEESVYCSLKASDGAINEEKFAYVIGCDGAHSVVRHAMRLSFIGKTYQEHLALADLQIAPLPASKQGSIYLSSEGMILIIPFGNGNYRIIAKISNEISEEKSSLADFEAMLKNRTGKEMRLSNVQWMTHFRTHCRIVKNFQVGRVFLAGDAAHIHNPAGGQGMNTGIQDALNLTWKLGFVYHKHAAPGLLATYQSERLDNAKKILLLTDRLFCLISRQSHFIKFLRRLIISYAAKKNWIKTVIAQRLSQISNHYRNSCLSAGQLLQFGPKILRSGDRAPDSILYLPEGGAVRLFELFRRWGFHLLIFPASTNEFGPGGIQESRRVVEELKKDFGYRMIVNWILTPRQSEQLKTKLPEHYIDLAGDVRFNYSIKKAGIVLIRPDHYIAYVSKQFDVGQIRLAILGFINRCI